MMTMNSANQGPEKFMAAVSCPPFCCWHCFVK